MSKRKRTPKDIWNDLVDEAGEDAIERAASVSVQQAEKELAAAGFDVAAERAKASALLDDLERGSVEEGEGTGDRVSGARRLERAPAAHGDAVAAVAQEAPPPSAGRDKGRRRGAPPVMWIAAAATVTVGGGLLYAALRSPPAPEPLIPAPPPSTSVPAPPVAPDLVAASDLRHRAAAACGAQQWTACLEGLDKAAAIDPRGDDAPAVRTLRARANEELLRKPKAPVPP